MSIAFDIVAFRMVFVKSYIKKAPGNGMPKKPFVTHCINKYLTQWEIGSILITNVLVLYFFRFMIFF
jgi:hypothetical protein